MPDTPANPPTIDHKPHAAFFRQSGWMVTASILGGAMSFLMHFLNKSKSMKEGEYGNFGVMLMVVSCLPTIPLQMVFAQQSAAALAEGREGQLSGMIRRAWACTFVIWLVVAIAMMVFRGQIMAAWKLPSAGPLYVTVFTVLAAVWLPLFSGVLQGRQDFFWYGWSLILGGVMRVIAGAAFVILLSAGATGMLAGALAGVGVAGLIVIWRSRDLWMRKPEPFDTRKILIQIMPLVFAFGVYQFLFTSDTMYAKVYFSPESMNRYVAAGTLSRALLWLVMPMAAVMFPKLVHSNAKGEKSNLLGLVILGTAALAIVGAIGLCIVGPIVVRFVYKPGDVPETVALLPWYAGAMIPLALANVLVNDLMARGRFKVVPLMVVIGLGYAFTLPYMLNRHPGSPAVVLQTLGVFTTLLFIVCAWFTWGVKSPESTVQSPQS